MIFLIAGIFLLGLNATAFAFFGHSHLHQIHGHQDSENSIGHNKTSEVLLSDMKGEQKKGNHPCNNKEKSKCSQNHFHVCCTLAVIFSNQVKSFALSELKLSYPLIDSRIPKNPDLEAMVNPPIRASRF